MALLWVGSTNGLERGLVERAGVDYVGIQTGQVRGINPFVAVRNGLRMVSGAREALRIISDFRPDVCLTTGGYVCAPVVFACWLRQIPVLIYLPDMAPGWAIRGLSKMARRVAVSLPGAADHFGGEVPKGKAVITGYPVRQELVDAAQDRPKARETLAKQLDLPLGGADPLLLVWGGSQGSRSINFATWQALEEILPLAHILHIVGQRDWEANANDLQKSVEQLPTKLRERYHPLPYLHEEMALALAAADLSVARAGASTLGEFPVARLPSIVVPLPFSGVNQEENAQELAQCGAAVVMQDAAMERELTEVLKSLLVDIERRKGMEQALANLALPDAAFNIARELVSLGTKQ